MGSIISLGIDRLEIDWGKNELFRDHSKLFTKGDIAEAQYYYADNQCETKPAYVRTLGHMVRRLELLGYTLKGCRVLYDEMVAMVPEYYPAFEMTFDEFAHIMRSVAIRNIGIVEEEEGSDFDLGEFARTILSKEEFVRVKPALSEMSFDDGTFFGNLDPYITLRLLAENPDNLGSKVIWRFEDVVANGYIEMEDIEANLADSDRFLLVTEGSSDSSILSLSLPLVAPDIADFFYFVDTDSQYPFTGAGSVVQFFKGLNSIRVQNKVLILLDNDTAGNEALQRIEKLPQRGNLQTIVLPLLADMTRVLTRGPSGETIEDVNGRAVSIECFLELNCHSENPPVVRWTSFSSALQAYQGELIDKERYSKEFYRVASAHSTYDLRKLKLLWDFVVAQCVILNERVE